MGRRSGARGEGSIGLLVNWAFAGLFWLTARPTAVTLDWAWSSYAATRQARDQLRRRQGELTRVLKSLDASYHRLERLNDELARARQAAERAHRLKSEFAASISHELRTPLNLIVGFSEMMVLTPHAYGVGLLTPAHRADIDAIYRNARHLAALVDDVLDLSQIEAGRMGLTREEVDVAAVMDEAVQAVAARFHNLGLGVSTEIAAGLPPVFADRTRVRQVLINLLNNAARFTDRGGAVVRAERSGNDVVVSVADTGVGIAAEELPHVFQEFHQTGSALERRVGGSGLGLTISKRFVELHGGSMWAASVPGRGSVFSFSLPLAEQVVAGTLPGDWATWDDQARGRMTGRRDVAVVAEDETALRVFQRYLDGYRAVPVGDGVQLGELTDDPSLYGVVIAAGSPQDAWARLAQVAAAGSPVSVVVCAADVWRSRAEDLGVVDYLSKPVFREQLGRALEKLGKGIRTVLVVDDSHDLVLY